MSSASFTLAMWFWQEVLNANLRRALPPDMAEHCVGTDRALGASFVPVFLGNGVLPRSVEDEIRRLVAIARACVVFDDMLRDHDMPHLDKGVFTQCLARSVSTCKSIAGKLCGSPHRGEQLVERRLQQIDYTYAQLNDDKLSPEEKVFGRCALLGLPFDIMSSIGVLSKDESSVLLRCARVMLFLLQLADDHADLNEDQGSSVRYNLILEKQPTPKWHMTHSERVLSWTCLSILGTALVLRRLSCGRPTLQSWTDAVEACCVIRDRTHCSELIETLFQHDPTVNYSSSLQMSYLSREESRCITWRYCGSRPQLCAQTLHIEATLHALSSH